MKKLLFTLLTAACFAGAASAVTDSWNETSSISSQTKSFSIGVVFTIDDVDSFLGAEKSNLIAMAYNTVTESAQWFYTSGVLGTGPAWVIATDGKVYGKASNGNIATAGSVEWESSLLKTGENAACVTVDISGTTATYTLYINGTQAATSTHNNINASYVSFNSFDTYADATAVYVMEGVASQTDIASLPEPTALALLALGAAGLALRRKMA